MKKRLGNKGFTLIELLVTVAILGILAAILVPSYTQYITSTKGKICEVNRLEFIHSFKIYKVYDGGNYNLVDAVEGRVSALNAEQQALKCPSGGTISATETYIECDKHGKLYLDGSGDTGGGSGGTEAPSLPGVPNGSLSELCEYLDKNFASSGQGLTLPQGSLYEYKGSLYAVGWSIYMSKGEAEAFAADPVGFVSTKGNFHKLDTSVTFGPSNVSIHEVTKNKTWNPPLFKGAVYTDGTSSYIYLGTDVNGSQDLPQGDHNGNWVKLKTGITSG